MMKHYLSITFFLLLFISQADAKRIEGWVIKGTDTMEVTLRIPTRFFGSGIDFPSLQRRIRYFNEDGKRRHYKPHEVDEVVFNFRGTEIRMFSHPKPSNFINLFSSSSHVFMKLDIEGELRLYTYFTNDNTNNNEVWLDDRQNETYYLQKGNGELRKPSFFKFRDDMMSYLSDCDALVKKLKQKVFRRWDLWEMVDYYNRKCD